MKPITIIGGGLAGLTLGILLRREGAPVTIFEASHYPRHRVCGEFISGAGAGLALSLGLKLEHAVRAHSAKLLLNKYPPIGLKLADPALCISRFELDQLLASEFQRLGGELRPNERFTGGVGEGVIRATGRRRAETGHGHLFGLKAHALNVELAADLEMHFEPHRYVGVCRLPGNRANICGLFYSKRPLQKIQETWRELLCETIGRRSLEWDEASFCSVAGLSLATDPPENEFCIGDAATMIPPLTGNGMSMAFESASIAAPELQRYCQGTITWADAIKLHASNWNRIFTNRLRWANWTQRFAFHFGGQYFLYRASRLIPKFPQLLFARTR